MITLIILSVIPAGCAINNRILFGSKASSYLGDLKERFVKKPYTVKEVRWRGNERIIALIFNTDGGGFKYISRFDDGIHFYSYLILDRTKEGNLVTEDGIQSYIKEIEKNKLKPFVIFDSKGEEKSIIFTKVGNQIYTHINSKDYITIEISDNLCLGRKIFFQSRRNRS